MGKGKKVERQKGKKMDVAGKFCNDYNYKKQNKMYNSFAV